MVLLMLLDKRFVISSLWFIKNGANMHYTESISSSSNKCHQVTEEIDTQWVAVGAKCTQLVYCQPCTLLPEISPVLHGLEKWPQSRLKIQNSLVIQNTFTHAIKGYLVKLLCCRNYSNQVDRLMLTSHLFDRESHLCRTSGLLSPAILEFATSNALKKQ